MNRKQYLTTLAVVAVIIVAVVVINLIQPFIQNWLWIFIGATLVYMFIRYRISAPVQLFSTKFNMLVDYDLDLETANKLAEEGVENAPTSGIKAIYMVYSGMAKYYKGDYRNAINTLNQIELRKLNPAYHVLVFAFVAYSAYEEGDIEAYDNAVQRIKDARQRVSRRYAGFAMGYLEILEAIRNLDEDPEHYREVVERHFSREDGYITTKLIYNYRMAYYYKAVNNLEEMDKCLAKVIANGKKHHTVLQAEKLFQNTCNIEDFVFTDNEEEKIEDVEVVEDNLIADQSETETEIEETVKNVSEVDKED